MLRNILSLLCLYLLLMPTASAVTLKVALYPYVPQRLALFQQIEAGFEAEHPGVNLELLETSDFTGNYYGSGLLAAEADVYEIDTIFLDDMISAGKITPLEALPAQNFAANAVQAVSRNGQIWAVPHWLCGNFLFFDKADKGIANARTWPELNAYLAAQGKTLAVDLKGSYGLGEWYLTALAQRHGTEKAQAKLLATQTPDPVIVSDISQMLENCPAGYCRNEDHHDRFGMYARKFMAGEVDAYIGYSESLNAGIQYTINNCMADDGCRRPDQIAVRTLPAFREGSSAQGIGWVDGLAIASHLEAPKKQLAEAFLAYMARPQTYAKILTPDWGEAPRYLLPALMPMPEQSGARLYPAFEKAHQARSAVALAGIKDGLPELGRALDFALPGADKGCLRQ